jgi:hypothetical protein
MLNDELNGVELKRTLRAALPRTVVDRPSRDLFPDVLRRAQQRAGWSPADWSAAAVVIIALLLFPKWFWFVAYHL